MLSASTDYYAEERAWVFILLIKYSSLSIKYSINVIKISLGRVRPSLTPLWNLTRKVKRFLVLAMCTLFWRASILALSSPGLKQAFLKMTQRRIVIYIRLFAKAVPSLFYKLCVPLVPLHQLLKKSCLWQRTKPSSASMKVPKRVVLTAPTPLPMYSNGGITTSYHRLKRWLMKVNHLPLSVS